MPFYWDSCATLHAYMIGMINPNTGPAAQAAIARRLAEIARMWTKRF
jgi:hypothetical protein